MFPQLDVEKSLHRGDERWQYHLARVGGCPVIPAALQRALASFNELCFRAIERGFQLDTSLLKKANGQYLQ
jgi:hypothetical protein